MSVAIVYPPYSLAQSKKGSASIHIGHVISILREECNVSGVYYIDYNNSPFYMYSEAMKEIAQQIQNKFPELLHGDIIHLLNRLALESIFDSKSNLIKNVFNIESSYIEKIKELLVFSLTPIINEIVEKNCSTVLLFVSPDITYSLALCELIKRKKNDIKIIVCDNFTFEPATPYFSAFVTEMDRFGRDIRKFLVSDPLSNVLKLKLPQIADLIVIGEGYDVFRSLFGSCKTIRTSVIADIYTSDGKKCSKSICLENLENMAESLGIVNSSLVDLDSLPMPDFSDMKDIFESAELEIVRGCSYKCIFCERSGLFDSNVRAHSVQYCEKLIRHVLDYNFDFYTFIDAAFNVDEQATISVLERIKEENIRFSYQANLRCKQTSPLLINLMKSTGCTEIAIGVESGDKLLLDSMNKVQSINMLEDLINKINNTNMKLMIFLILGFPTETESSVDNTIDFIKKINTGKNIDVIEVELYHVGHIQRLGPHMFDEFGLEWQSIDHIQNQTVYSRIYVEPGICGFANFKYGMDFIQINRAVRKYHSAFSSIGVKNVIAGANLNNVSLIL